MASLIDIVPLMFLLVTTFYHFGEARIIEVGGSLDAWKVPESPNHTLSHWAESVRFQVGDALLFKYDSKMDSVLQVTEENYEKCNTEKPLKEHKDGYTTVKLDVSGPYFFISGAPTGNCAKGEKVTVVVQSPNHQPMPKPGPAAVTPTIPPKPSTTSAAPAPAPPTPSPKSSTSMPAPAPAPAKSSAVGLVAGTGIFWASTLVAVIGLAFV
ncbi:Phytocyanin domain [Arabidopsis thaliana x Arabidopsis arenosa]|uniref:Phytocyanin domain n=1 Tax=Arabidopsis thaliana x Arabidopsis arenosa TaxID=1240361 RepID=A0A8T2A637_9BRAS|nr:Phytocyanin domain [Arabidopsis thaliana x Arabidopsis arenosa]